MQRLHGVDPRYGFDRHKGYATPRASRRHRSVRLLGRASALVPWSAPGNAESARGRQKRPAGRDDAGLLHPDCQQHEIDEGNEDTVDPQARVHQNQRT